MLGDTLGGKIRSIMRHLALSNYLLVPMTRVSKRLLFSGCQWITAIGMSFVLLAACGKTAEGIRQEKIEAFENELILGAPPDRIRDTDGLGDNATGEAEYEDGEQDGYLLGSNDGYMAGSEGEDCDSTIVPDRIDPELGYDAGKTHGYSEGYAEACAEGYEEFSAEQTQQEEDQYAAPSPDIGTVTYKVKAGDTLSRLAKLFNTTVTVLMQLNQMVGEPLFVGQNLVVPGSAPQTLPVPGEGVLFDVGTKVIKLADPGGRRYLKVGIVLEFAPHDTAWYSMAPEQRAELQALFETEMGSKQPVIEDLVISIISSKSFEQVYTLEGKEGLRQEIINRINQLLPTQLVMYVYFNEFVVQ